MLITVPLPKQVQVLQSQAHDSPTAYLPHPLSIGRGGRIVGDGGTTPVGGAVVGGGELGGAVVGVAEYEPDTGTSFSIFAEGDSVGEGNCVWWTMLLGDKDGVLVVWLGLATTPPLVLVSSLLLLLLVANNKVTKMATASNNAMRAMFIIRCFLMGRAATTSLGLPISG